MWDSNCCIVKLISHEITNIKDSNPTGKNYSRHMGDDKKRSLTNTSAGYYL